MTARDFKKGMNEASKSFESKFTNQEKRFSNQVDEISNKINNINGVMDDIIDIVEEQDEKIDGAEKRRLYNVEDKTDIGELEEYEREFLAGLIVAIPNEFGKLNQEQQKFTASVFKYINIIEPDMNVSFEAVENIENVKTQKAILRAVMELMFLKNNNFGFMANFDEVIQYFSINRKGIVEIKEYIQKIYDIVGVQGLCEKYGYVEEIEAEVNEDNSEKEIELTPLIISKNLNINVGETVEFNYNDIKIEAPITCEGILRISNCNITISDYNIIHSLENSKIEIYNSQFNKCSSFITTDGGRIKISDCVGLNMEGEFIEGGLYNKGNVLIENTEFYSKEKTTQERFISAFADISLDKCKFYDFDCSDGIITFSGCNECLMINVSDCSFINCSQSIISNGIFDKDKIMIDNCIFKNCKIEYNLLSLSGYVEVRSCKFEDCCGGEGGSCSRSLICYSTHSESNMKCNIKKCEFKNVNIKGKQYTNSLSGNAIIRSSTNKYGIACDVSDCVFDNCI